MAVKDVIETTKKEPFQKETGYEQVTMILVTQAKFYFNNPGLIGLIGEAERIAALNEEERHRILIGYAKLEAVAELINDALKKGIADGSIRADLKLKEAGIFVGFAWRAIAQRLLQIHLNNTGEQKVFDTIEAMRAQLAATRYYLKA